MPRCAECGRRVIPTGDEPSDREMDVLRLLAYGMTNRAIAESLCVIEKTVKNHITSLKRKFKARNRFELVWLADQAGFLRDVA